jgi:peptide/nickel transport system permease protein
LADTVASAKGISKPSVRSSEWQIFKRVFFSRKIVIFGLILIFVFIMIAILAPLISPYPPNDQDLSNMLQQPDRVHLLGTDTLGRDILSRVIYGSQTSLIIGSITVCFSCFFGMLIGLAAGYYGGWTHFIVMRFVDALMSFPMIILALTLASVMGSGIRNIILALGVAMMPAYARMMCGQVLSIRENDYILADRTLGARDIRIMLRHIVPNCIPPLIVMVTVMLGGVVLAEAGLSFLGIGIVPPTPAWGSMINDGREYIFSNPVLCFAPGVCLMLLVFGFNMVGDGLRDALDPRLRGTL